MDESQRVLARGRLERAYQQIAELHKGPNAPTSTFEDWVATVKSALRIGIGDRHSLVQEFDALTTVHRASKGQIGVPGSFQALEQRTPTYQVLTRSQELIEDALTILAQGGEPTDDAPALVQPRRESESAVHISPADPASADRTGDHPKVLISYAWEGEDHRTWVRSVATELRCRGIDVILDQWQVHPGDRLTEFMEQAIAVSEFILIVCTPQYKAKSEGRKGGVGYEGNIMTGELFARNNERKFIPVVRDGDHDTTIPNWLAGKAAIDLRGTGLGRDFDELVVTLRREREDAPPLGPAPRAPRMASPTPSRGQPLRGRPADPIGGITGADTPVSLPQGESNEPIRLLGIPEEHIGTPRQDGTRGSALYAVPIQLSRRPSPFWANVFVENWDRPPQFTSMHRPGIARVEGDRIILDGTTLDEVDRYHRDTLKLVVEKVNQVVAEIEARSRAKAEAERRRQEQHQEETRKQARSIKFD